LLAERENASVKLEGEGSDLQFILSDLVQSSKLGESKTLASDIQGAILSSLDNGFTRPKDLGVKKAPFYVLVGAHMPSVLVELAFIDNATEGKSLADKGYRRALAEGVAAGVLRYLQRGNK
jgi:N-acetylmuramoyl-L-alanine amidase